jgi:hypothetical protein
MSLQIEVGNGRCNECSKKGNEKSDNTGVYGDQINEETLTTLSPRFVCCD